MQNLKESAAREVDEARLLLSTFSYENLNKEGVIVVVESANKAISFLLEQIEKAYEAGKDDTYLELAAH